MNTHTHTCITIPCEVHVFYEHYEDVLREDICEMCINTFMRTVVISYFWLTQRTNSSTHMACEDIRDTPHLWGP